MGGVSHVLNFCKRFFNAVFFDESKPGVLFFIIFFSRKFCGFLKIETENAGYEHVGLACEVEGEDNGQGAEVKDEGGMLSEPMGQGWIGHRMKIMIERSIPTTH